MRTLTAALLLFTSAAYAAPRASKASVVRVDASHPELRAFAQKSGLARPGYQVALTKGELHYSADGWKTTHKAELQYLRDNSQGFLIRDLGKGSKIEYAVHATLGASYNHFRSFDGQGETWANNGGRNYVGKTAALP
jgi:hypothetical protein